MGIWRSVSEASPRARAPADVRANASAAAAAVLFGASVVAVRVAVRDVPPVSLAVLRFGLGGLLLAGILLVVAPRSLRARWERLPRFALLGLVLFVLFPLTFLSNVFVEPGTMPGWLQAFVKVNPITHLVAAVRSLMAGDWDSGETLWVLAASGVLVAIFGPLTMRLYNRK